MMKRIAMSGMLLASVFLWAGHADAGDPPVIDSQYLKAHYPDVYLQIYREGKEAGQKEAEAALKNGPLPAQAAPVVSGAAVPAVALQAKPDLGAWWEKSSLKYSPLPERWLFHIEGTLDYKHKTGNTQSDLYNGSASLMVRKLRFTNTLYYIINKEFTAQIPKPGSPSNQTDTDYRSVQESLRYDLTDRLYTEGGYMWEKDQANYISGRDIYYAGIGYALVDTQRNHLEVFVAGGYQEEMFPDAVRAAMNMDRETVTAGYFREDYRWNINDRFTYKQTFRIIRNFTSSHVFNDDLINLYVIGETNRYRWFLINEIYYKLAAHLNFMTGYKVEYDSNPWPTVQKLDTTVKSGIQFSF